MTKSTILNIKPTNLLEQFLEDYSTLSPIDKEYAKNEIQKNINYYTKGIDGSFSSKLEKQWYDAIKDNKIDYSVYEEPNYWIDTWCCWKMYSRNYLKILTEKTHLKEYNLEIPLYEFLDNIKTVIDMGNGLGYSTGVLKELFNDSKVYGYNISGTTQYEFNQLLGKKYNFEMVDDYSNMGKIDLLFASEYFEHFERPIEHLQDVIQKLNPDYLIIANSFNTKSIGHFITYKHDNGVFDEDIDQKVVSRRWIKELKNLGYEKLKANIFNNKPSIYRKIK